MSKITIEDVTKIIFDIKDKHNITDKKFEIFALAAVLDELKMEDFYNLSILRTSGDKSDADYPFQIEFPTNYDLYGRYDKEKKYLELLMIIMVEKIHHMLCILTKRWSY